MEQDDERHRHGAEALEVGADSARRGAGRHGPMLAAPWIPGVRRSGRCLR
jgi:hypothetical protein